MPNAEKIAAVAEITEHFTSSSATVITEYRGLSVKQVTQLRRSLGRDTTYAVVKNTLTKRAAAQAGIPIDDSLLTGPTAIAFVKGDPVEAARGLRDFAKTHPLLIIKGGVLEGKILSSAEVAQIADLDSRDVLLAKLAGALKALPTRAAALFQAPLSQLARLAKALEEKKSTQDVPVASAEAEANAVAVAVDAESASAPPDTPAEANADAVAVDAESASAPPDTPAEPAE